MRLQAIHFDGRVELHVRDEGPGFADEFLPQAFERFARSPESRPRGGAGLGLAIVSVIAKAHGGTTCARNDKLHGGADVWIALPERP